MADHIPFISGKSDCEIVKKYYSDSHIIRLSLESIKDLRADIPKRIPVWIDPGIDGYHFISLGIKTKDDWRKDFLAQFAESDVLIDTQSFNSPNKTRIQQFVKSALDKCREYKPAWITIPQLPVVSDNSRNKINRMLASATNEWRSNAGFDGKLILPLIFSRQQQLKGRTQWKSKLELAKRCFREAGADGVWAVDADLEDEKGSGTFDNRFPKLIEFYTDLKDFFREQSIIIAGPHWGINLVLWVKGLCDYPAVGLGTGYRYYITKGHKHPPLSRIALPPLRRRAIVNNELRIWLDDSLSTLSRSDAVFGDLKMLLDRFDFFAAQEEAKTQVAQFYKNWFNKIETNPPSGRTLALYQDLASAYVLGRQLAGQVGNLPSSEKSARDPAKIAKQLMLICL